MTLYVLGQVKYKISHKMIDNLNFCRITKKKKKKYKYHHKKNKIKHLPFCQFQQNIKRQITMLFHNTFSENINKKYCK